MIKEVFNKTKVKFVLFQNPGFYCDAVVRSESEEELMVQVSDHAKEVHDVTVTDDITNQVRTAIRVEE